MSEATLQLDDALQSYLHAISLREPGPCRELRARARTLERGDLISSPEQVQLLAFLARVAGAWRILEVGTFVGYTPLWLALALPAETRVTCIDHDREASAMAREAWAAAGIDDRIDQHLDDAATVLAAFLDDGQAGAYDLAYIDADKENLEAYYEHGLRLVRPGGLVAVDNTLWKGRVADPGDRSPATEAVRVFNEARYADERVDLSLVPIGDGLTLLRKRETDERPA